ncbi:hypothetical protein QFC22_001923 [Naganishia vaughanmartiniae]|uniref:Uncharacterized protein n=1 Tax=Naganishia vaughanmartiniae TaxID=1424756 RepID=A0ACC2XFW6_9TREE|nr:hypothetical protein QFC22_001923 [Naganishia vaughanmartiniae]
MRFGVAQSNEEDDDLAYEVQELPRRSAPEIRRPKQKRNNSRYGVDLDYSSSSSISSSSSQGSDSSSGYGSLPEEENNTSRRKAKRRGGKSSRDRSERRQELSSRLSALREHATTATAERGGKGIEASLDEWDRWEMISQQQARLAAQKQSASFNLALHDLAADNFDRTRRRQDTSVEKEMDQVLGLLKGLEIKRMEEEKKQVQEFDKRNKALWDTIEQTIKAAEAAQAKIQAEKEAIERKAQEIREEQQQKQRELQQEVETRRREAQAAAAAAEAAKMEEKEKAEREAAVKEQEKRQAVVKAAEERQRKQQLEREITANAQAQVQAKSDASATTASPPASELVMKRVEWQKWREVMGTVKAQVIENVKQDDAVRRGLRRSKNTITMRLGQVVNTRESIVKITEDLDQHLCSQLPARPSPAAPFAFSSQLPIPYLYLLSHISKSLIKQAESEISAKPEAAYPLAKVVIGLLLRGHQALNDVLFARLVKKCCWVIPYFPPKQPEQMDVEYRKSIGQKDVAGTEDSVQYNQRMAAILTVYLAICSADIRTIVETLNDKPTAITQLEQLIAPEFRITACWSWLAMMGKAPLPNLDPAPKLVSTAFEMVGQDMIRAFGMKQMRKMAQAYMDDGLGGKDDSDASQGALANRNIAARAQLRLLLEPFLYEGADGFEEKPAKQWDT